MAAGTAGRVGDDCKGKTCRVVDDYPREAGASTDDGGFLRDKIIE